ncbi:hypothetical protein F4775DRAFT_480009 [Biscogniauxia sp. FL1348]|nr:hypothetical protein F4775DRAFT_480009 [Biscogniauxia sp. FL1348]
MELLRLPPPFSLSHSLIKSTQLIQPANTRSVDGRIILPHNDLPAYLHAELRTPRLNHLHKHLWLAGRPVPARPLHRQHLINRNIVITELPDEHIVWYENRMFIKPLPDFLLSHEFWTQHLCADEDLHASACGMLLSYAWLVGQHSDFHIAVEKKLIPEGVAWQGWTAIMCDVLDSLDLETMAGVNPRYQYGELRLSRLNMLTRWLVPSLWSRKAFIYGYMSSSTWYTAFFRRQFGWLLGGFAYISVLLSALQVGLATEYLNAQEGYQQLGYGISLASMAVLALGLVAIGVVSFGLFCYHVMSTLKFVRRVRLDRERAKRKGLRE